MNSGKDFSNFGYGRFFFLILFFVLFSVSPLTSAVAQTEDENGGKLVSEVIIRGDVNVNEEKILAEINFSSGDRVTEKQIEKNAGRIKKLGLFEEVSSETLSKKDGLVVRYNVVENPVINEIVFKGNELLNAKKLKKALGEVGIKTGKVLNTNKLDQGLKKVTEKYKDKGYPLVTVGNVDVSKELKIEIIEGKLRQLNINGLVTVPKKVAFEMIDIPKGKPVKLKALQRSYRNLERSVYFEKVNLIPRRGYDKSDIILEWNLKERTVLKKQRKFEEIKLAGGSVFSASTLRSRIGDIPEGKKTNYQLLKALSGVYERYVESGYTKVDFDLKRLESGKLVIAIDEGVVKEIEVTGNTKTSTPVILGRMVIKEGIPFNNKDLKSSRRKLLDLGYFKDVSIESSRTEEGVKVKVDVEEKKRLSSIKGSASWSGGNIVGSVTLSQKNLFGSGQNFSLDFKRGFSRTAGLDLSVGWKNHAYPYRYDYTQVKLYRKVDKKEDGKTTKTGFDLSLSYPLTRNLSISMGFNHEYVDESNGPGYNSNVISTGLTHDNRDNPMFPTFGGKRTFEVSKAGDFAPGLEFNIFNLSISQFFPLPEIGKNKQAIALRFDSAMSFYTPESKRPRFGGAGSLRGFDPERAPSYALLNTEYRAQVLPGRLYLSTFVDAGLGYNLGSGITTGLKSSLGLEANLRMFGNIRLGAAWPLKEDTSWIPEFYFSMGPIF